MKAKDIRVGHIYVVEKWKGGLIPFRVDRVAKSPVRRSGYGQRRGGDVRAYGIELGPASSLTPLNGTTLDFALSKVVRLWDADAWAARQVARANQDEVDRRDRELGARLCNALADRNVGASYDGRGLLIARSTLGVLAKVLGVEVTPAETRLDLFFREGWWRTGDDGFGVCNGCLRSYFTFPSRTRKITLVLSDQAHPEAYWCAICPGVPNPLYVETSTGEENPTTSFGFDEWLSATCKASGKTSFWISVEYGGRA